MPRVCMCGCAKQLIDKNGVPDYRRKFFGAECLRRDKSERMQVKREEIRKRGKCPMCGLSQREKKQH
jgi:Zn ribbon nucleic-acid-binding protein